jgi:hypothetical protein
VYVKARRVPRRLRTAETFRAADPWNGRVAADFTVEVYKYVPERVRDATGIHALGAPERFGIRSNADGVERMLPQSLTELWQERRVSTGQLPRLLHALEPELSPRDLRPMPRFGGLWAVAGSWLVAMASAAAFLVLSRQATGRGLLNAIMLLLGVIGLGLALGFTLALPIVWSRRLRRDRQKRFALDRLAGA